MHTKTRQEIFSSFIDQVQREMLEAVKAGDKGVVYHKDDIKCDPDDFVKWLRREGFIFKWDMGGLFRKPVLYIQFER